MLGAVSPRQRPQVTKARSLFAAKPETRSRNGEVLSSIQGAIPSSARFPRWKAPRSSEWRDPSRDCDRNEGLGGRCGRVQARERASIPSRTHRQWHEGSEGAIEEGPRDASPDGSVYPAREGGLPLLRSFDLRVSHVPRPHLKGVGHGGEGSRAFGVRVSSPGVGEVA